MMKIAFSDYEGKILHAIDYPAEGFSRAESGQTFNLLPIRWDVIHRCIVCEIGLFSDASGRWEEIFYRPFRESGNSASLSPGDTVQIGVGELILSVS